MRSAAIFCLAVAWFASAVPAQGKVFLTADKALELAFPKCKVTRQRHALSKLQLATVKKLAGTPARRAMTFAYEARKDGKLVGTAYFDRHRVRTLQEVVMIVVSPMGKVVRIEVLAFGEPRDYLPRGNFYAQFRGRGLDADLSTKRKIRAVTGATLTVHATVSAARRILAVHRVLYPQQVPPPKHPANVPAQAPK